MTILIPSILFGTCLCVFGFCFVCAVVVMCALIVGGRVDDEEERRTGLP